jgi:hypothetical protein
MKRFTVLILAFALMGCATVNMSTSCPANSTGVGFALAGSTVGNTALSMLGTAAAAGMLAPKAGVPAATTATMSYHYLPIFGADSGSLNCVQPPTQTVVVTSPPASIVVR